MPATKTATQPEKPKADEPGAIFSFIPAGKPRSIAEHLAAVIAGAVLLFAFFLASEIAYVFNDMLNILFFPVACIIPALAGAVAALVLEKVRGRQISLKRGAAVGAAAGLLGSLASAAMLLGAAYAAKNPFGSMLYLGLILVAILALDTAIGALGGALLAKFMKD